MTISIGTAVRFTVNGVPVVAEGPGSRRLLDILRDDLGLTGTKEGCGEGECGACSVLLDGRVVNSCLVPIGQVAGGDVRTVEGLATDGRLGALQEAFLQGGAVQCGFCTPGMLASAAAFLASRTPPTDEAVREAIAGNLCRCTGYTKIVEAIQVAAGAEVPVERSEPPEAPTWGAPFASPERPASGEPATAPPSLRVPVRPPADARRPDLVAVRTLPEALHRLAEGGYRPIAGGTDLMVGLEAGTADPSVPLLDLWALDELRGIRLEGSGLVLGALTTYAELRASPVVREHLPAVARMAGGVGAVQIQNRGTLGGNLVNASPAGDTLPLLLATDAEIVVQSVRGERAIPATAFWTGYRRTALAPDELVVGVRVPLPPARHVVFRKIGTRRAQSIAKASVAVAWRTDESGAWRDVRVALGAVAERAIRAPETEAVLEGRVPARDVADEAARVVAREITPIDDVRSTAEYRRAAVARVLRRIVLEGGDAVAEAKLA